MGVVREHSGGGGGSLTLVGAASGELVSVGRMALAPLLVRECGADLFEVEVEHVAVDGVEVWALADGVGGPSVGASLRSVRGSVGWDA